MDARLALRTSEERARALHGRADSLVRAAETEREARARAVERRERLVREGRAAQAVGRRRDRGPGQARGVDPPGGRGADGGRGHPRPTASRSCWRSGPRCATWPASTTSWSTPSTATRWPAPSSGCGSSSWPSGPSRSSGSTRTAWSPTTAPTSSCPSPASSPTARPRPSPAPFDRDEQTKRLRAAERALALLGKVNPLALEEFSALEERHKFLTEQLEDLKATRKDLLDIVREVDARVQQVFTEAYADVAAAFEQTFSRLFPGGEGRLVLTDPSDMLATGVEVEARPPGKKVKRLSLLSGGERSLVAVAFLVALFKARPSPFYILDEVEAALDDTNLGRLLQIYEELREHSQLLVITHQKRTMEVGDALYGVTMRGDGVSTVISQRLREPA